VGAARDLPRELTRAGQGSGGMGRGPLSVVFEDASRVRFPLTAVAGGAGMLTRQSLCPFQAFAATRLGADEWEPAEAGLNARQRGQLLHAVLHRVWGGAGRGGISTHAELAALDDMAQFVRRIAVAVMRESFAPGGRNSLPARFPARLLEIEVERLTRLVSEWLEYERRRLPFTVAGTEERAEVTIAGLKLGLRMDRMDRLEDGSLLVIDYKSSDIGPAAWGGERPDDVQLPLYATFAVPDERLEGLVFARVRPGKPEFCGRVRDAAGSLLPGLSARNGLISNPLSEEQLAEWRGLIEELGEDFIAGDARVDPKDPVKTCARCGFHAVCRIYENQPPAALADEDEDARGADEPDGNGGGDG
jgi:ATP-dependent helicase/nuclease subunit B